MADTCPPIISWLLTHATAIDDTPIASLDEWKTVDDTNAALWTRPFDRAVSGGFMADRVAYAFVSGFRAALQYLFPNFPTSRLIAFGISEEGGNHPRAIQTQLVPAPTDALQPGLFSASRVERNLSLAHLLLMNF